MSEPITMTKPIQSSEANYAFFSSSEVTQSAQKADKGNNVLPNANELNNLEKPLAQKGTSDVIKPNKSDDEIFNSKGYQEFLAAKNKGPIDDGTATTAYVPKDFSGTATTANNITSNPVTVAYSGGPSGATGTTANSGGGGCGSSSGSSSSYA